MCVCVYIYINVYKQRTVAPPPRVSWGVTTRSISTTSGEKLLVAYKTATPCDQISGKAAWGVFTVLYTISSINSICPAV